MNRREFLVTAAAAGLAGCATSGEKKCCAKAGACGGGRMLFGACRPLKDAALLKAHGYDFFETSVAGILMPTCSDEEWKKQNERANKG